jgi:hypothetical protein
LAATYVDLLSNKRRASARHAAATNGVLNKGSPMGFADYQEVKVTLSAATFSRLEQGNPFNKRRVADQAIEAIRVAVYTMYPPRTPEEWKDRSRFQGAVKSVLLIWYDLVCYLLRKLISRHDEFGANHVSDQPAQITLKIPIGLMSWIDQIAHSRQSPIPDATVYAIEYGLRVLELQGGRI